MAGKKSGALTVGQRGKQKIIIRQKKIVKESALMGALKRLGSHFGRRAAAWLPVWRRTGAPTGSHGPMPASVTDNEIGARGGFNDSELLSKDHPAIEAINFAVGAQKLKTGTGGNTLQAALNRRLKAMTADLALYLNGTKKAK